jgi:uncharacterized protein YbaP (TraB family)
MAMVVLICTWASAESSVWKVQKGKSIIYVGATFHILRETDYPLPPEFDKAYKASDIVVFETDIGKLHEPSTQLALVAQALYADGSTVEQHLSAESYGRLSAYCTANGIPLESLKQLKPSMLMVTLTTMELMKLGVTGQGVDSFYYGLAQKDRKTAEGLETVEEQINYIVSMADGNEDDFVTYSLQDIKTIKQQFEILVNAWRRGDAEKVNELMAAELESKMPKLYTRLITERNAKWLPLIDAYLKTPQTEFILVGAGHLVGPKGIIEVLKKKGYTVGKL